MVRISDIGGIDLKDLRDEIIERQTAMIGQLTTNVIELDARLGQALATVDAFQKELEGLKNGDIEQPDATGRETGDAEGLQQG